MIGAAWLTVHRERVIRSPIPSHLDQCAMVTASDGAVQMGLHDGRWVVAHVSPLGMLICRPHGRTFAPNRPDCSRPARSSALAMV